MAQRNASVSFFWALVIAVSGQSAHGGAISGATQTYEMVPPRGVPHYRVSVELIKSTDRTTRVQISMFSAAGDDHHEVIDIARVDDLEPLSSIQGPSSAYTLKSPTQVMVINSQDEFVMNLPFAALTHQERDFVLKSLKEMGELESRTFARTNRHFFRINTDTYVGFQVQSQSDRSVALHPFGRTMIRSEQDFHAQLMAATLNATPIQLKPLNLSAQMREVKIEFADKRKSRKASQTASDSTPASTKNRAIESEIPQASVQARKKAPQRKKGPLFANVSSPGPMLGVVSSSGLRQQIENYDAVDRAEESGETDTVFDLFTGSLRVGEQIRSVSEILREFATDLVDEAKQKKWESDPRLRATEDRIIESWFGRALRSAAVLAPSGAGKSHLMRSLAARIANGDVPDAVKGRKLIRIHNGALGSGTVHIGMSEYRFQAVVEASREVKDLTFVIDEVDGLQGQGAHRDKPSDSRSAWLEDLAEGGHLSLVGFTSAQRWHAAFATDEMWRRRFVELELPADEHHVTVEKVTSWILSERKRVMQYENLPALVEEAIRISSQFDRFWAQPGAAVKLVDRLMSRHFVTIGQSHVVTLSDLQKFAAEHYKVDASLIAHVPVLARLESVERQLKQDMVGIDEVWKQIRSRLMVSLSGLDSESMPLGRILFFGPPGGGKTTLVGTLAKGLRRPVATINLDSIHSVEALKNRIALAIRNSPSTVLFFDEIDKADAEVALALSDVLAKGELVIDTVDVGGKMTPVKLDLSASFIFAAANGDEMDGAKNSLGFQSVQISTANEASRFSEAKKRLSDFVPANILDRFDLMVNVPSVTKPQMIDVLVAKARSLLKNIRERERRSVEVSNLPAWITSVVDREFQSQLAHRDVNRTFDSRIRAPLVEAAAALSSGSIDMVWDVKGRILRGALCQDAFFR